MSSDNLHTGGHIAERSGERLCNHSRPARYFSYKLTPSKKLKIIRDAEKHGIATIARAERIRPTTLQYWVSKYRSQGMPPPGRSNFRHNCGRRPTLQNTEPVIFENFLKLRAQGAPLSGRWLELQAKRLGPQLDGKTVQGSSRWKSGFRKRWQYGFFFPPCCVP